MIVQKVMLPIDLVASRMAKLILTYNNNNNNKKHATLGERDGFEQC